MLSGFPSLEMIGRLMGMKLPNNHLLFNLICYFCSCYKIIVDIRPGSKCAASGVCVKCAVHSIIQSERSGRVPRGNEIPDEHSVVVNTTVIQLNRSVLPDSTAFVVRKQHQILRTTKCRLCRGRAISTYGADIFIQRDNRFIGW